MIIGIVTMIFYAYKLLKEQNQEEEVLATLYQSMANSANKSIDQVKECDNSNLSAENSLNNHINYRETSLERNSPSKRPKSSGTTGRNLNLEMSNRKFSENLDLKKSSLKRKQDYDSLLKSWQKSPNLGKRAKRLYEKCQKEKLLKERAGMLSDKKSQKKVVINENSSFQLDDFSQKLTKKCLFNTNKMEVDSKVSTVDDVREIVSTDTFWNRKLNFESYQCIKTDKGSSKRGILLNGKKTFLDTTSIKESMSEMEFKIFKKMKPLSTKAKMSCTLKLESELREKLYACYENSDLEGAKIISKEWLNLRRKKFTHSKLCNLSFGNIEEELGWE